MVAKRFRPARRHNKEPDIMVLVGAFARRIDPVDIQVNRRFNHL